MQVFGFNPIKQVEIVRFIYTTTHRISSKLAQGAVPTAKSLDEIATDIKTTGGFTYDINTGEIKQVRFAVAIEGYETPIKIEGMSELEIAAKMYDYARDNANVLSQQGNHLGGWLNPADGVLYLDISNVTTDIKQARSNAVAAKQEGVYDFQTKETIIIVAGAAQQRTKEKDGG